MKKLRLLALILIITLFNIGALTAILQNVLNSGNTALNSQITLTSSGEEFSEGIEFCNEPYSAYSWPFEVYITLFDEDVLVAAYYQIDSHAPLAGNLENWTTIFTGYHNETYEGEFTINDTLFDSINEGLHYLYIKFVDDTGNWTQGPEVVLPFYKDITPPIYLELISPANGTTVSGEFLLKVQADDNEGGVGIAEIKFFVGNPDEEGELIDYLFEEPWELTLNASDYAEGTYEIYIRAYDCAWNSLDTGPYYIIIKHKEDGTKGGPDDLLMILLIVGAVAGVATTSYVVVKRRRTDAYSKTISKLDTIKEPKGIKPGVSSYGEPGESTYILPEDSQGVFEMTDKLKQLSLSDTDVTELSSELQGLPNGDRVHVFNAIIGSISMTEAEAQLDTLMQEIPELEKAEKWTELLGTLEKGIELAEFIGDDVLFNKLLSKIDIIRETQNP